MGLGLGLSVSEGPRILAAPLDIIPTANVIEYYRTNNVTQASNIVSAWPDQSGKTSGGSQGTSSKRPAYVASDPIFNNQPSIKGDGVDDHLTFATGIPFPGTTPSYWFIVAAINTVPGSYGIVCGGNTNFFDVLGINNGTINNAIMRANTPTTSNNNGFGSAGVAKVVESYQSNSTSDFLQIGSVLVSGTNTGNQQDGSGWGLFSHGGTSNFINSSVALILRCNVLPSTNQRNALKAYAASLYGGGVLT